MSKKVSVLIPCYNERATIEELLSRVEAADFGDWQKEIIVVDDGSKDNTRSLLEKYKTRAGYTIVFHEKNQGKGGVERTGIDIATGDYIVLQDADLEYDPREIKRMLDVVDRTGAPVVFGSRNMDSAWKRLMEGFFIISIGVWASTKYLNILYGTHLTDAWTCYKLFSREVSRKARFIGNGFEADYLFIGEVAVAGFPIVEVPITHAPRTVEEGKKIRYKDGAISSWLLLKHRLSHLKKARHNKEKTSAKLEKIKENLLCPLCGNFLKKEKESFVCEKRHPFNFFEGAVPILAEKSVVHVHEEEHLTGVNWLKSFLKQFPTLYYGIWGVFCPVLMLQNGPRKIEKYTGKTGMIADIGSGPDQVSPEFINVDIFPFPGVDVVADAKHLPFADGTFDGVVTESMLEHVANPKEVALELGRVVKPGGYIYASAPFMHPYHASPDDFNRFTTSGLKELFPGFETVELGIRSGPWSAFLMFFAYFLGVIFAFGSRKAAPFLAHIFMLVLGPLKVFDPLFSFIPGAEAVSAHLYIIARKPSR